MRKLTFLCLAAASPGLVAEELDVRSNPERDQLFVTATTATVELQPGDDEFVRVEYDCVPPEPEPAPNGLKLVKKAGSDPYLSRSSDKINIRFSEESGACRMRITAPPGLATQLRINEAGRIRVSDWRASLNAWSAAGDVVVMNQQGPFSLTAMKGDVTLEYTAATLDTDSAITASDGTLKLALPGTPGAELRARAKWGDILTDLDVVFIDQQTSNGTWSVTELGDGGPVITLRNLNENIEVIGKL